MTHVLVTRPSRSGWCSPQWKRRREMFTLPSFASSDARVALCCRIAPGPLSSAFAVSRGSPPRGRAVVAQLSPARAAVLQQPAVQLAALRAHALRSLLRGRAHRCGAAVCGRRLLGHLDGRRSRVLREDIPELRRQSGAHIASLAFKLPSEEASLIRRSPLPSVGA